MSDFNKLIETSFEFCVTQNNHYPLWFCDMIKKRENWHSVSDNCKQKIANKIKEYDIPQEQKDKWNSLLELIEKEIALLNGE